MYSQLIIGLLIRSPHIYFPVIMLDDGDNVMMQRENYESHRTVRLLTLLALAF